MACSKQPIFSNLRCWGSLWSAVYYTATLPTLKSILWQKQTDISKSGMNIEIWAKSCECAGSAWLSSLSNVISVITVMNCVPKASGPLQESIENTKDILPDKHKLSINYQSCLLVTLSFDHFGPRGATCGVWKYLSRLLRYSVYNAKISRWRNNILFFCITNGKGCRQHYGQPFKFNWDGFGHKGMRKSEMRQQ